MAQQYIRTGNTGLQSADHFQLIVPSDTVELSFKTRAIYVGGAGNITMLNAMGVAITFIGLPVGAILPVVTNRVNATLTTATNLIAMY
jgi:hypothetical protein